MSFFQNSNNKTILWLLPFTLSGVVLMSGAAIIPANNSDFYYKIGGGQDVPLPAFYDTKYYSIKAEGEIGLGFEK